MFIDTHAHVNFNAFKDDSSDVLKDCLDNDVWVVNVGTQKDTSQRAVEMAGKFSEGVYAAIGLHPVHLFAQHIDEEESSFETREEQFDPEFYASLADDPKVVAIGECGLDYFHLPDENVDSIKQKQKKVFEQHIDLASKVGKTLMVHCRDAYSDLYEILVRRRSDLKNVIIHSFIGGPEDAQRFLKLDCYLSFNGIVTYKPRREQKPGGSHPDLQEAVRLTPLDRILLETDCPYLSPEGKRGERNTPQNVKLVAEKIVLLKGVTIEEVAEMTSRNARKIFSIGS